MEDSLRYLLQSTKLCQSLQLWFVYLIFEASIIKLIFNGLLYFVSGDQFVLQMDLIDHVFDNMIVEEALVRIILPEGATNIEVETPYAVTRLPDSLHFTYLDTKGRPVIELSAKNLVENHIQEFKVNFILSIFN